MLHDIRRWERQGGVSERRSLGSGRIDLADRSVSGSGGLSPAAPADRDPCGAADQQVDTHLGEVVLARAVSAYRAALGSRLIAAYALGSLAHGGFSPLVSDVDLGLILQDPLRAIDRMTIRTVARRVRAGACGACSSPERVALVTGVNGAGVTGQPLTATLHRAQYHSGP